LVVGNGKVYLGFTPVISRGRLVNNLGFTLLAIIFHFPLGQGQFQLFKCLLVAAQTVGQFLLGTFQFNIFVIQLVGQPLAVKRHHYGAFG